MYKPPPDDDEQNEEQVQEEGATGKISRVRPRQSAVLHNVPEKPHREFYSDEHPEVPRVRRASLNKGRAGYPPVTDPEAFQEPHEATRETSQHTAALRRVRKELPPFTGLEEEGRPPTRSGETSAYTRLIRQQTRQDQPPFTGLEDEPTRDLAPTRERETGAYERLGRRPVNTPRYSPITPVEEFEEHTRHKASAHRDLRTRRPHHTHRANRIHPANRFTQPFLQRKQNWILAGLVVVILLLIIVPRLFNTAQSSSAQNGSISGQGVSLGKLQGVPSNEHELVIQPANSTHSVPPVEATSAYLLDAQSLTTYYAQNPFLHLPMLSTTKLMTAALAVEEGNLDQKITITSSMEHDIDQLSADSALFGVKKGETYTLQDLLYGLLFVSGNDAALVIADALAGSVPKFVAQMNQKAQTLGLRDTHFVNPHGLLDAGQYSCARDLAVLGLYALSLPSIQKMDNQKTYHIAAAGKHGARVLLNENQFLWWYPGVNAGKTGYDGASDFVQVMLVTRNHRQMVGVVMHTGDWWTDMRDLMDYGSNDYTWISPRDVDASGQPIPYDDLWNYFSKDTQKVTLSTANGGQYFVLTGISVSGPFLTYFNKQGGLKKFGYPTQLPVSAGGTVLKQHFQNSTIQCDFSNNTCSTL